MANSSSVLWSCIKNLFNQQDSLTARFSLSGFIQYFNVHIKTIQETNQTKTNRTGPNRNWYNNFQNTNSRKNLLECDWVRLSRTGGSGPVLSVVLWVVLQHLWRCAALSPGSSNLLVARILSTTSLGFAHTQAWNVSTNWLGTRLYFQDSSLRVFTSSKPL